MDPYPISASRYEAFLEPAAQPAIDWSSYESALDALEAERPTCADEPTAHEQAVVDNLAHLNELLSSADLPRSPDVRAENQAEFLIAELEVLDVSFHHDIGTQQVRAHIVDIGQRL